MKRPCWTALVCAAATIMIALVASSTATAQDYTVRMNSDDGTTTTYVSRNAVRTKDSRFDTDVIYRLAEDRIININHKEKTYSVVTLAEMRAHNEKLRANMSPQQKEMMSRMGLNAAPTIIKMGAGESIAGYATEKYVSKTPMMETEIWAAPALALPQAYYDVFATGAGQAGPFGGLAKFSDAGKTIKGMVLKQTATTTMMNHVTLTKVATAVDKTPIPASTFEPPTGYRNVPREP